MLGWLDKSYRRNLVIDWQDRLAVGVTWNGLKFGSIQQFSHVLFLADQNQRSANCVFWYQEIQTHNIANQVNMKRFRFRKPLGFNHQIISTVSLHNKIYRGPLPRSFHLCGQNRMFNLRSNAAGVLMLKYFGKRIFQIGF